MSWQTNPLILGLRTAARSAGLTRVAGRILNRGGYEAAFDDALFAEIAPGDVVWDVGANVGYYTRKFAEAVGPGGRVVAFEPFPATIARLRAEVAGLQTVKVLPIALGAQSSTMTMRGGADSLGATSRIVCDGPAEAGTEVEITTGDAVIACELSEIPTVAKIDTEGFELDVLQGMQKLLSTLTLRAVFVEVHFSLLADRGLANAPGEIERLLKAAEFGVHWVDPSHIVGRRS
jgi:FkbM family methyltransferase